MSKMHSSEYFRTHLASAAAAEPEGPQRIMEKRAFTVADRRRGAVANTTPVHAASLENTSYPLCRGRAFTQVTMCIEEVTCESCILMLEGGRSQALEAGMAPDVRAAAGKA
jgi:hypothetical protein